MCVCEGVGQRKNEEASKYEGEREVEGVPSEDLRQDLGKIVV